MSAQIDYELVLSIVATDPNPDEALRRFVEQEKEAAAAKARTEGAAQALRTAADMLQITADPSHVPTWLRDNADRIDGGSR